MAFRHILVPTDGSSRSRRAARTAIQLAGALRADVTGLFVIAEGVPTAFSGSKLYGSGIVSPANRRLVVEEANRALADIERLASGAGVRCRILRRVARHPWRAILGAAHSLGTDLIVMGSHGRTGMRTLLLGSQTTRVLAHSKRPVLVCR